MFPFFKELVVNLGWGFFVIGGFVIVGAGNAVNFTDGLDGLAIVPVMIAAASFGFIAYLVGNEKFAEYLQIHYVAGTGELAVLLRRGDRRRHSASCGSTRRRRSIFMGDTGSLALGGTLGAVAVAIKHEIVLAIIGGLFVLETDVGDRAGGLVQAHRQARVPHGADPPSLRAARLDRAAPSSSASGSSPWCWRWPGLPRSS